ncbi:MAG TPA: SpoIIE family protein phosphatase [Terriglobia bacterium]|nr:SpoIIE family protein phosphatase [Terriglobia bacterium]
MNTTTQVTAEPVGFFPERIMEENLDQKARRALIADDQTDVLEALHLLLKGEGYQTELVTSPRAVLESLKARQFDLLLMDLNYARDTTSGQEGLDLLAHVQALDSTLPIVVMTAWSSVPLAVEAMRRGVRDFVQKPWENAQLLDTLSTQIEWVRHERARLRLEQMEREDAREIERRLLPEEIPQIEGCEIACAWQPASSVGGDYFDVLKFGPARAGLCIADVMGKGVPAALLMSNLQAAVRATGTENVQPSELGEKLNRIATTNLSSGKFITFFYALLEGDGKRLVYTNAGHNPPILMRADGSHIRLEWGGTALGVVGEARYEQETVDLRSGDRLVLFTDGVTEAVSPRDEEYGEERLLALLRESRAMTAVELQMTILNAVNDFSGGALRDDATMIVVAVK